MNIIGGVERQIRVNVNREKLQAYHMPIGLVVQAIDNANRSYPAGKIETEESQYSIRFDASLNAIEQLRELVIRENPDGGKILLGDVAELVDGIGGCGGRGRQHQRHKDGNVFHDTLSPPANPTLAQEAAGKSPRSRNTTSGPDVLHRSHAMS